MPERKLPHFHEIFQVAQKKKLTPYQLLVLLAIRNSMNPENPGCWRGQGGLAKITGLSRTTVKRCCRDLVAAELLDKEKKQLPDSPGVARNDYFFPGPSWEANQWGPTDPINPNQWGLTDPIKGQWGPTDPINGVPQTLSMGSDRPPNQYQSVSESVDDVDLYKLSRNQQNAKTKPNKGKRVAYLLKKIEQVHQVRLDDVAPWVGKKLKGRKLNNTQAYMIKIMENILAGKQTDFPYEKFRKPSSSSKS